MMIKKCQQLQKNMKKNKNFGLPKKTFLQLYSLCLVIKHKIISIHQLIKLYHSGEKKEARKINEIHRFSLNKIVHSALKFEKKCAIWDKLHSLPPRLKSMLFDNF